MRNGTYTSAIRLNAPARSLQYQPAGPAAWNVRNASSRVTFGRRLFMVRASFIALWFISAEIDPKAQHKYQQYAGESDIQAVLCCRFAGQMRSFHARRFNL